MADRDERIAERIRIWRDELIDLSRRNRLLNATAGKSAVLRIQQPSIGQILAGLNVLDNGEKGRGYWRFHYPPSSDLENADPASLAALHAEDPEISDELEEDEFLTDVASSLVLSRRLRALERQVANEFMDKGVRNLYLGLGVLRWADAPGEWVESPIVMMPLSLERTSPREPFRIVATDDDPVVNPALRVKMETDFAIELPPLESIDDAEHLIAAVRERMAGQVGWTVSDEALFGRFSFQKEAMYQDLRANVEQIGNSMLVRAIADDEAAGESLAFDEIQDEQLDDVAPPEELYSILDADSTQRRCIVAARDGCTFVMDGPPGTGKSQTIANMIAELVAADKTVLFVSEKAAALDVVKSRLDAAHLGSYVLELHSNKATRKEVAQALGPTLTERPRPVSRLDVSQRNRVRQHRRALSAFAVAQNEVRQPFDRTLHWAIGRHLQLAAVPTAPPPTLIDPDLSHADYDLILDLARRLSVCWGPVERRDGFLWRDLRNVEDIRNYRSQIPATLDRIETGLVRCRERFEASTESLGLAAPRSRDDYLRHVSITDLLGRRYPVPPDWLRHAESESQSRLALVERWTAQADQLTEATQLLSSKSGSWRSLSSTTAERLSSSTTSLAALNPRPAFERWNSANLGAVAETLEWMSSAGPALEAAAGQLRASLGLPSDANVSAMKSAVALGRLGAAPHLPERQWFDPDRLAAAKRSLSRLRPIVDSHRSVVDQLQRIFNPAVFQFDIETLYDNQADVVPMLSRTSTRGRASRKQVKFCALNGKLSSEVVSALPLVRQWHAISEHLREEESSSADALGDSYYRSTSTDFGALEDALELAETALRLLGSSDSLEAVGQRLSVASSGAPQIAANAERLKQQLDVWTRTVGTLSPIGLTEQPAARAVEWAARALQLVRDIQIAMEATIAVFPSVNNVGDAQSICESLLTVQRGETLFAENDGLLRSTFGDLYRGLTTHWSDISQASEWSIDLVRRIGQPITENTSLRMLSEEIPVVALEESWNTVDKALDEVIGWFGGQRRLTVEAELHGHIDDAVLFLGDLRESMSEIDEWLDFEATARQLADRGFSDITQYCVENGFPRAIIADVFERSMLTTWIDRTLAADARCAPVRAEERDRLVEEFRALDRMLVANAAGKVMNVANRRRPATIVGGFAIIRREAEKKKKHRPIRTLLDEAGTAVLALKPCFMMSPLSVSQFLPPSLKFDVVIFDEASQVRPCDAVGAIYRGDQLIVAGDNKQLPPTNFFDKATDDDTDEYDEEAFDEFESVLDLCRGAGAIQDLPLRWHYRSRHEDLITYSNRAFYDSSLVTYPGSTQRGPNVGVELIYVPDGVYGRGTSQDNQIEARKVVERVLFHADHHPEMTLGVVAFSEAQATRVQWELEAVRRERPDLDPYFRENRLDGFFIKNLESVQGDERDIIIFSVGYGRDENGKFTMNFGPLNKPGGQRRLNVAITRARSRVEVVASIRASDFADSHNLGVHHLRGYLDYAERGAPALTAITAGEGEPESPFEVEVLATLRRWGYEVEPQVGQAGYRIDMGIRHPEHTGQWLLGVECDGAAYHSSATARDRDRLRQQVLEGLGWQLHRIWGPSWYHDRRSSEARLRAAIEMALRGEQSSRPSDSGQSLVHVEILELSDDPIPGWTVPYRAARLDQLGLAPDIEAPAAPAAMRQWVMEVVRQEGPVHPDVMVTRLREHWRAEGLRSRFRRLVESAIQSLVQQGSIRADIDGFLSAVEGPFELSVRVPNDGDELSSRAIREVSPSELRRAIVLFVRDAREIGQPELALRIARIFGWRRTGTEISEKIGVCVAELVHDGTIREVSPGVLRDKS